MGGRLTQWIMLAVMGLGLFMNASLGEAFTERPRQFVAPFLLIQVGRPIVTALSAPHPELRRHYWHVVVWVMGTAPLWLVGAALDHRARLAVWGLSAALDVLGSWNAHPVPTGGLRSDNLPFQADHMLERIELLFIISLGEVVLTTGTALTETRYTPEVVIRAVAMIVVVMSLWFLHFHGAGRVAEHYVSLASDKILAVRLGINAQMVELFGLVLLAVAAEVLVPDHHEEAARLLLWVGPVLFLTAQSWYVSRLARVLPWLGLVGALLVAVAGGAALLLPVTAALVLMAVTMVAVTVLLVRTRVGAHE